MAEIFHQAQQTLPEPDAFFDFLKDLMRARVLIDLAHTDAGEALYMQASAAHSARLGLDGESSSAQASRPGGSLREQVRALINEAAVLVGDASDSEALPLMNVFWVAFEDSEEMRRGIYVARQGETDRSALLLLGSDPDEALRSLANPMLAQEMSSALIVGLWSASGDVEPALEPTSEFLLRAGMSLQRAMTVAGNLGYESLVVAANGCRLSVDLFGAAGTWRPVAALLMGRTGRAGSGRMKAFWSSTSQHLGFHMAGVEWSGSEGKVVAEGWGKSQNPRVALDKAIGEAVERRALMQLPKVLRSPAQELQDHIDPRTLVSYTERQYRRRDFPLRPFNPSEERPWVEAKSVTAAATRWLLADCVFHPLAFAEQDRGALYTHANSSGCASAISVDEAIFRAALELIERDAFMRHWFAQRGGWELAEPNLPASVQQRARILAERRCSLVVQRLDLGLLPVWMATIQSEPSHFTAVGLGCSADTEQAMLTALFEAEAQAHARLSGVGARLVHPHDVRGPQDHSDLYAQRRYFRRADHVVKVPHRSMARKPPRAAAVRSLYKLEAWLQRTGLELVYVDLSAPSHVGNLKGESLHCVRAFIPGLIPLAFGARLMPLGMDPQGLAGARFPHPFA